MSKNCKNIQLFREKLNQSGYKEETKPNGQIKHTNPDGKIIINTYNNGSYNVQSSDREFEKKIDDFIVSINAIDEKEL